MAMFRDERVHFASLVLASQLGAVPVGQVVALADQQIMEQAKPAYWLIELSTSGNSAELTSLIDSANDEVFRAALRLAYDAWLEHRIGDETISAACEKLALMAGYPSKWYDGLAMVDDHFELASRGIADKAEFKAQLMFAVERLIADTAESP